MTNFQKPPTNRDVTKKSVKSSQFRTKIYSVAIHQKIMTSSFLYRFLCWARILIIIFTTTVNLWNTFNGHTRWLHFSPVYPAFIHIFSTSLIIQICFEQLLLFFRSATHYTENKMKIGEKKSSVRKKHTYSNAGASLFHFVLQPPSCNHSTTCWVLDR